MAAYQTQQVNVGSIAAPNVGQITGQLVDRINRQQSNQLDNIMQAAQFDRQQLLNQRADKEYARGLASKQEIANIAKEYTNAPYAAKFGADEETKALDKRVLSMPQSTWENLTPEQAEALQAQYENVGQNKESARTRLMGELMKSGNVDYTAANAVAEDLTKGLMSRADKQAALDAQYKAKLDSIKEVNDYIDKTNKYGLDIYKAKLDSSDKRATSGGVGGTGSSGGSGHSGISNATTMDNVYDYIRKSKIGSSDTEKAFNFVDGLYDNGSKEGVHPGVILYALQNNTPVFDKWNRNNDINTEGIKDYLAGKAKGVEGLQELRASLRSLPVTPVPKDPIAAEYLDPRGITRQIYNSTPDSEKFLAEALKNDKLAFLRTPEEQDKIAKAIAPVTSTNSSGDKKYADEKMPEGLSYNEKITWLENRKAVANGGLKAAYETKGGPDKGWGRYQMMGSTLDGYRKDFGNFTNEQFRNDPELQDKVFAKYNEDNEKSLVRQGVPVNEWTKWLAHNLGSGNVKDFLNRNETPQLKDYMKRQSGSPKNIDEYIDKFGNGFKLDDTTTIVPRDSRWLPTEDTAIPQGNSEAIKSILDRVSDKPAASTATEKSEDIKAQLEALNKKGLVTKEDFIKANELNNRLVAAKANEKAAIKPVYQKNLLEIFGLDGSRNKVRSEAFVPEANAADEEKGLEDSSLDFVGLGRMAGSPIRGLNAERRFDKVLANNSDRLAEIAKRKDVLMKKYKNNKYETSAADEAALEEKLANERSILDHVNAKYTDDVYEEILAKAERSADAAKRADRAAKNAKAEERAIEARVRNNRKDVEDNALLEQAERERILAIRNQPRPTEAQLEVLELKRMLNKGELDESTYRYLKDLLK